MKDFKIRAAAKRFGHACRFAAAKLRDIAARAQRGNERGVGINVYRDELHIWRNRRRDFVCDAERYLARTRRRKDSADGIGSGLDGKQGIANARAPAELNACPHNVSATNEVARVSTNRLTGAVLMKGKRMKKFVSSVLLGALLVATAVVAQKPAPAQASFCGPHTFTILLPDGPHEITITVCNLDF